METHRKAIKVVNKMPPAGSIHHTEETFPATPAVTIANALLQTSFKWSSVSALSAAPVSAGERAK